MPATRRTATATARAVQYRDVREAPGGGGTLASGVGTVVAVVVVGACIAVVTRLALGGDAPEPATTPPEDGRAASSALVRLRSVVTLGCLSVLLGVAAAAGIGIGLFVLLTLLRASVG